MIDNMQMLQTNELKFLGLNLDTKLHFSEHINKVVEGIQPTKEIDFAYIQSAISYDIIMFWYSWHE